MDLAPELVRPFTVDCRQWVVQFFLAQAMRCSVELPSDELLQKHRVLGLQTFEFCFGLQKRFVETGLGGQDAG